MQQHTYAIMDRVEDSHWWFVGRRAILESFLRTIVANRLSTLATLDADKSVRAPLRILDVGCGTGANLEMLSQFGSAEGVDVSDEALAFCRRKGLAVQKGLAEKLPYADETFDITTALDVVQHLDDDVAGLKEMHRVTKTGGYSLIFVPAFMWLWGVQDDISHHRSVSRDPSGSKKPAIRSSGRPTQTSPSLLILGGRAMKLTGIKPDSENNINVSALNGLFGKIFSPSGTFSKPRLPFGVSISSSRESKAHVLKFRPRRFEQMNFIKRPSRISPLFSMSRPNSATAMSRSSSFRSMRTKTERRTTSNAMKWDTRSASLRRRPARSLTFPNAISLRCRIATQLINDAEISPRYKRLHCLHQVS